MNIECYREHDALADARLCPTYLENVSYPAVRVEFSCACGGAPWPGSNVEMEIETADDSYNPTHLPWQHGDSTLVPEFLPPRVFVPDLRVRFDRRS
jgi:hypothetical protein